MLQFRIETLGQSFNGINGEIKDVKDTILLKKIDEKINVSTTKFNGNINDEIILINCLEKYQHQRMTGECTKNEFLHLMRTIVFKLTN